MRKAIALVLLLCVGLLSACGKAAESEVTVPETTTEVVTEEITTPMPSLRADIIAGGVSYDVIKLDEVMLRLVGNWEDNSDKIWSYRKTLYFPENKSVCADYFGPGRTTLVEIILRDRQDKKETVLLEWSYNGHNRQGSEPFLVCEIDEHYALIHWRGWDANLPDDPMLGYSLLDINTKKNITIDFPSDFVPHFLDYNEGYLYFNSIGDEFYRGEFRPMRVKLSDIESKELIATAVPEDVTITGHMSHYLTSSRGGYLAATIQNALLVFDMKQRTCIFRLESSGSIWNPRLHLEYYKTRIQAICYKQDYNTSYLIEITLPK